MLCTQAKFMEMNRLLKNACSEFKEIASYMDVPTIFAPNGVLIWDYFEENDGIHLNERGATKLAELVKQHVLLLI